MAQDGSYCDHVYLDCALTGGKGEEGGAAPATLTATLRFEHCQAAGGTFARHQLNGTTAPPGGCSTIVHQVRTIAPPPTPPFFPLPR